LQTYVTYLLNFLRGLKFNISFLRLLLTLNLIPLLFQTHNYWKTPSQFPTQHWWRKHRKTPPRLDIFAQTHWPTSHSSRPITASDSVLVLNSAGLEIRYRNRFSVAWGPV